MKATVDLRICLAGAVTGAALMFGFIVFIAN